MPVRDCACLIVGNKYSWDYVDRLYSMLCRNSTTPVRLTVLTEPERPVPAPYIKKDIVPSPLITDLRHAWWYKMQLFDHIKIPTPTVYFDLDLVIIGNIDWIWETDPKFFWTIRDFQCLWKRNSQSINSSIMRWDPKIFYWIWEDFCKENFSDIMKIYLGDQNYLNQIIPSNRVRFLDEEAIKSWRWQVSGGGWDFSRKKYLNPGTCDPGNQTKIIVFHGDPKPHAVEDRLINQHWK